MQRGNWREEGYNGEGDDAVDQDMYTSAPSHWSSYLV